MTLVQLYRVRWPHPDRATGADAHPKYGGDATDELTRASRLLLSFLHLGGEEAVVLLQEIFGRANGLKKVQDVDLDARRQLEASHLLDCGVAAHVEAPGADKVRDAWRRMPTNELAGATEELGHKLVEVLARSLVRGRLILRRRAEAGSRVPDVGEILGEIRVGPFESLASSVRKGWVSM